MAGGEMAFGLFQMLSGLHDLVTPSSIERTWEVYERVRRPRVEPPRARLNVALFTSPS